MIFEDIHIKDLIASFKDVYALEVVIDDRVVAPPRFDGQLGEEGNNEYVTDGVVRYKNPKEVSTHDALIAITKPLGLDFGTERGYVWISTPQKIAHETFEDVVSRTYDVRGGECGPSRFEAVGNAGGDSRAAVGPGVIERVGRHGKRADYDEKRADKPGDVGGVPAGHAWRRQACRKSDAASAAQTGRRITSETR